jgi:hypothetical protein
VLDTGETFLQEEREWRIPLNRQILTATPGGLTANRFIDDSYDHRERRNRSLLLRALDRASANESSILRWKKKDV